MSEQWVRVADEAKLVAGTALPVYPNGLAVLLVHADGAVHAVANKCAHMACPLEAGKLDGPILTCPCHDWRFDVRSGAFLDAPELSIRTFPVKLEEGGVLVDLQETAR